jgi:diguanylate cyclase
MSQLAAALADLGALRAELQQLRHERDALAARVLELEQQVASPSSVAPLQAAASFEESFRVEQSRAKRQRLALSVALVELDGIQDLRDRLGHSAGEEALAHLARVLERALRPTDVVSAVDGLAFGLLLTATSLEQALTAVTRLQQDFAQAPLDTGHGQEALTFSAGLVQWRTDEALGDLLSRASRALGLARRGGVAKVVVG